ncbi:corticotropin-releasing factor-binding protein [Patella vulgata]|uniref:corticotropin-releasing factor-binding protein n=1 Tax=Patella vulgata TaxID=6465 RepID=UPI00217F2CEC|nr:corticotropin-releasing factor-binding protein [Patella vulgata]
MFPWTLLVCSVTLFHDAVSFVPFNKRSQQYSTDSLQYTPMQIDCIDMRSVPGDYYYESEEKYEVCGFYIIAEADRLVEIEITEINVNCDEDNALALVDGWELQGEYFPSPFDHKRPLEERYQTLCGNSKPHKKYISSQNVALIQFLIPSPGQSFKVKVRFIPNSRPCNVVATMEFGILTLKNYGERANCSISIIYPEKIYLVDVDVGVSSEQPSVKPTSGLSVQCSANGKPDYVELLYGDGLDTDLMGRKMAFCGLRATAAKRGIPMGCQHSVVRLVSSGSFYNSITFSFQAMTPDEIYASTDIC